MTRACAVTPPILQSIDVCATARVLDTKLCVTFDIIAPYLRTRINICFDPYLVVFDRIVQYDWRSFVAVYPNIIFMWNGANATIHGCNIYNNTHRGVDNQDNNLLHGIIVNAAENWWGHEDGPHDPSNADFDQNLNPPGQWITDWVRYRWPPYGLWWLTSPAQW